MTVTQMKKDYLYLRNTYDCCEDMCGDICNCELFEGLLDGTKTREECYIAIMQRYYDTGSENGHIPEDDAQAQRIFSRWIKAGLIH